MLRFSDEQIRRFDERPEREFRATVAARLAQRYPAFLPRLPAECRGEVVARMIGRGRAFGLTWAASLYVFCDLMEGIAPDFVADPTLYAFLHHATGTLRDERMLRLSDAIPDAAWKRMAKRRDDLCLYTPATLDAAPAEARVASALPLLFPAELAGRPVRPFAAEAVAAAARFGLASCPDAPLAVAALMLLYPAEDWTAGWRADLADSRRSSRERCTMIRLRIMLDHGRRV